MNPLCFIICEVVIYQMPSSKFIAGLKLNAFGLKPVQSLNSYIPTLLTVLILEIATFAFCHAILYYKCNLNLYCALCAYMDEYGYCAIFLSCVTLTFYYIFNYAPFCCDQTFQFTWFDDQKELRATWDPWPYGY